MTVIGDLSPFPGQGTNGTKGLDIFRYGTTETTLRSPEAPRRILHNT